jgi:hypothetical protein
MINMASFRGGAARCSRGRHLGPPQDDLRRMIAGLARIRDIARIAVHDPCNIPDPAGI